MVAMNFRLRKRSFLMLDAYYYSLRCILRSQRYLACQFYRIFYDLIELFVIFLSREDERLLTHDRVRKCCAVTSIC